MKHQWSDQYEKWECELAKCVSDAVNTAPNLSANAEYLAHFEHRYLQNEAFKFFMLYMKEMANNYENGNYDGRSEYACQMSKHICELLEQNPLY